MDAGLIEIKVIKHKHIPCFTSSSLPVFLRLFGRFFGSFPTCIQQWQARVEGSCLWSCAEPSG
jgi:hypothetical protein